MPRPMAQVSSRKAPVLIRVICMIRHQRTISNAPLPSKQFADAMGCHWQPWLYSSPYVDPRISSTIVGISMPERLKETLNLAQQPLPEHLWEEIAQLLHV